MGAKKGKCGMTLEDIENDAYAKGVFSGIEMGENNLRKTLMSYDVETIEELAEKSYNKGRIDAIEETIPLLRAIKFVLDDYVTRLSDYSKVIDEQIRAYAEGEENDRAD